MAVQKKKLRVLPNPWQYIDHLGRPAGVCPCDPNEHTPDRRWVGATIAEAVEVRAAKTVRIAGQTFENAAPDHDITWSFSSEPVEIPNTAYYRQRIAGGELVAADLETATACGISREEFKKPELLLSEFEAAAIKQFDAENGEGAYDALNADRATTPKTVEKPSAQPAQPEKGDA